MPAPASIHVYGQDPTVRFAARELARYLKLATGQALRVVNAGGREAGGEAPAFELGLAADLGWRLPKGIDPAEDDCFRIEPASARGRISGGGGYRLAGSNPRSVLFAVYRYLRAAGFRWVRPGPRGEIVPRLRAPLVKGVRVEERASYRYRAITIEGACSFEHVRDLIDWMAKHAMNGYFIQFHYGTTFFRRWYEHRGSNVWKPEPLDQERVAAGVAKIEEAIRLRGMRFERMGHGWTCAALKVSTEGGWDKEDTSVVPADRRDWIAEVHGKRELWGGIALNTQLNFGDPEVRESVTDAIVAYAREHPEVNLLHFWLADGSNNHDERPESQAARPSDFYVDMLNDLDAKLEAAGLATRIVFLVYVDLLWAPARSRIRNPDRFVLMFAPITRGYRRSFLAAPETDERKTEFVRNKLTFPKSPRVNLDYLRDWQDQFRGDGFDFDYHAIWACYYDPGMFTIGRTLHADIRGLAKMGLHGLNSCQNQRMSFPHNLLLDVTARTLWDKSRSFDAIVAETFADAYGRDGAKAAAFFDAASKLWEPFFDATYIPDADRPRIAKGLRNLPELRALVEATRPLVARNLARTEGAVRWSWKYLGIYLELLERLLPAFESYLRAAPDMRARLNAATDWLWTQEKTIHPALDVYMIVGVLQWRANELENWLKTTTAAPTHAVGG